MFIIFGEKKLLVKYCYDTVAQCEHCQAIELSFAIWRSYIHFFFIPFCPVYENEVEVLCLKCGEPNNAHPRKSHWRAVVRTPFYLYSWLILIGAFIVVQTVRSFI